MIDDLISPTIRLCGRAYGGIMEMKRGHYLCKGVAFRIEVDFEQGWPKTTCTLFYTTTTLLPRCFSYTVRFQVRIDLNLRIRNWNITVLENNFSIIRKIRCLAGYFINACQTTPSCIIGKSKRFLYHVMYRDISRLAFKMIVPFWNSLHLLKKGYFWPPVCQGKSRYLKHLPSCLC